MGKAHGLRLWDAARELSEDTLRAVQHVPVADPAGLRKQLATAVHSICSNIAEGTGRGSVRERLQFLRIARGSLEEVQTHVRVCANTGMLDRKTFFRLWNRSVVIGRMLGALIVRLERS